MEVNNNVANEDSNWSVRELASELVEKRSEDECVSAFYTYGIHLTPSDFFEGVMSYLQLIWNTIVRLLGKGLANDFLDSVYTSSLRNLNTHARLRRPLGLIP